MPRKARFRSSLNYYHIIIRGVNKRDIFLDDKDKMKFLKEIRRTEEKYHYLLHAYVLMPNHAHLLIEEKGPSISEIMRSLLVSYAQYFNKKYDRIGYLFQDRFHSRAIENEDYFKNVVRYIHLNPQKAGIASYDNYYWSSYQEIVNSTTSLVYEKRIKEIFYNEQEEFPTVFQKYHEEKNNWKMDEELVEYEMKKVLEDEEVYMILKNKIGEYDLLNLCHYQKEYRDKLLMQVLEIKGTTCAQLSRVTGVGRKIILNCKEYCAKTKRKNECEIKKRK